MAKKNKPTTTTTTSSLQISSKGKAALSKHQQQFNRLTSRIEKLEEEIVTEKQKLNNILEAFNKNIQPLKVGFAKAKINVAIQLDNALESIKFSKSQQKSISDMIVMLFNQAFEIVEPDESQEALYDKWAQVSYKDEIEQQKAQAKEMFSSYMKETFNMDMDMDEFGESPESQAKFYQEMKEKFERSQEEQGEQRQFSRSKKEIAREEAQKADNELKNKNIRSIYIALAKVLHPDSETDEELKIRKEEVMKKVTVAYDCKDLPTLLKLEMEWVHNTTEHLDKLTDDKLKLYIMALKEQVAELEREKYAQRQHPRFADITDYVNVSELVALRYLKNEKRDLVDAKDNIDNITRFIAATKSKKEIMQIVDGFLEEYNDDLDIDEDMMLDLFDAFMKK